MKANEMYALYNIRKIRVFANEPRHDFATFCRNSVCEYKRKAAGKREQKR